MTDFYAEFARLWSGQVTLPSVIAWAAALLLVMLIVAVTSLRYRYRLAVSDRQTELRLQESALELRRDVYLPAAEAVARAQQFLARFPGRDWSSEDGNVVVDYVTGVLGRVHVVGSERVIKATMALATEFSLAFLALSTRKRPLTELEQEIEVLDQRIAHMSQERDLMLGQITRLAGGGIDSQDIWNELNLRFDKLHRQIATVMSERAEKTREHSRLKHELAMESAACSLKLAKLSVPAYLAIREELDMPIDEEEYRLLAHINIVQIDRAVQQLARGEPAESVARGKDDTEARKPSAKKQGNPAGQRQSTLEQHNLRMALKRP